MIIACTSKPFDGLLFYSYEYSRLLNIPLIIIPYPGYSELDYELSLKTKYSVYEEVYFDWVPGGEPVFILGRSMLTIGFFNRHYYTDQQLFIMKLLFKNNKLISVYSENHPHEYNVALAYFKPGEVIDLCDHDVYKNGVGKHFEKKINFSIYKDPVEDIQFQNLFLGTNRDYYTTAESLIPKYKNQSYAILTCEGEFVNKKLNNIYSPVDNLLGLFNTYVYAKRTFDPAPRLIQECLYFNKNILYNRDSSLMDGGYVYYNREISKPDVDVLSEFL